MRYLLMALLGVFPVFPLLNLILYWDLWLKDAYLLIRSRNFRSNQGTLNFTKDVKSELPGSRVTFRPKEGSESQFFLTETPQMYKSSESIHSQTARTSRIRGKVCALFGRFSRNPAWTRIYWFKHIHNDLY